MLAVSGILLSKSIRRLLALRKSIDTGEDLDWLEALLLELLISGRHRCESLLIAVLI